MVRGRYRVGVSKTKTKEKIMMKKKVMPLSCLMAAAMLAGCGTAAPAVPEETTAPAVETAEAAQETAPADAAESEAAAVEKTAGVWQVEPCYNFDEIVPLYSEWDHTAGKNAADGLYAVRDGERWSLFSTKTGNIMMQDAAQAAALEGSPYVLEVTDLTLKDDGTPDTLSAYTDCVVYIEFNEDGLPSFFAVAQEDVGYRITYTRTDDGRLAMDSAQCVYGYIYNHSAEPTNDFFTPTGEILYQ